MGLSRMKTVLLDLTSLNTSRRLHGVGRHVRELASGICRLADEHRQGLRFLGLVHLDPFGGSETTEDFGEFEGNPESRDPSRIDDEKVLWLRRFGLSRVAKQVGADLVHVPDPVATPWEFGRRGPLRVATCHDLARVRGIGSGLLRKRGVAVVERRLQSRRFSSADHVIAISSYTAEELRSLLGLTPSRVSVVYNGVDLRRWSATGDPEEDANVLRKYGVQAGAFVLYVGQASWRKNRTGMLRALRLAREARPRIGLQLVWAGKLAVHEASSIDREARNLGIRHAVHLLNFVPDVELASLYRTAAAHLFVSRHEGFGLTVVEAMSCGCPVITTRRTALAEVAGDAAVLVEPEEHEDISEAIITVTSDPALREDLRQRGLARVGKFSNDRQARDTVGIYQRVLGL